MSESEKLKDQEEGVAKISVNDYGSTKDGAVVVDETDRTVVLTEDETVVIEKENEISAPPKNRPRRPYSGMWGTAEIVTIGLAVMALLTAFLVYLLILVPSNKELEESRAEARRLEAQMITARGKYGDITNTETEVARLVQSVNDFESRFLPVADNGRTALYQRLNGLIVGYGLINTNGPTYAPLESVEITENGQENERGRERFQSLFPGVYVTMTVEGTYPALRRFIRDIETGNEFVVISSVELAPSEGTGGTPGSGTQATTVPAGPTAIDPTTGFPVAGFPQAQAQPDQRRRGRTIGDIVALRLELAAYFRRPVVEPVSMPQPESMN